jgi:nucleoside-diphosphate-sugar epimerase
MEKSIIVSGASGFIGSHLVKKLLSEKYNVIGLTRAGKCSLKEFESSDNYYGCDNVNKLLDNNIQVLAIVHTATQYHSINDNLAPLIDTNLLLPIKLLDLCVNRKIKKFINCDSFFSKTSPFPGHYQEYCESKKMFREWMSSYSNIDIHNLILGHVYGPNDRLNKFIPWFINELLFSSLDSIDLSPGEQKRDFIYVDDVIQAIVKCIQAPRKNGINDYLIGSSKLVSIKEICCLIRKKILDLKNENCPKLNFGGKPYLPNEIMEAPVGRKYIKQIKWQAAINIEDALERTIDSYIENV